MNEGLFWINLCIAVVMTIQISFYFNSVIGTSMSKSSKKVYMLISILLNIMYLSTTMSWIWSSFFALVVVYCIALGYYASFKVKILYSFLYVVLLTLVNTLCIFIFQPDMMSTNIDFSMNLPADKLLFASVLLFSCIIMFAVILVIRYLTRQKTYSIQFRYLLLFLAVPLISIYQVNVLILYSEKNIHYFVSVFGYLILNILVIYILDTVITKLQLMNENMLLQRQMDYQDANYEKTVHSFKRVKSIIHDTNQQFLYINACIEHGRVAEASEHIRLSLNMVDKEYHKVNTGNLAIDALLTNAINISEDNGIRIKTELRLSDKVVPIERYDLCVVLGNMLDNSLEASKKVKIAADRFIQVTIRSNDTTLFISIQNYVDRAPEDLKTRKKNATLHGFGLMNIKRICEKYGGHMTIERDPHTFTTMVMLPYN